MAPFPKLRKVVPAIPDDPVQKENLRQDLVRMGCQGLMHKPWGFHEERMVRELTTDPPNMYDNSVRAHPESWTTDLWRNVYNFRVGGAGFAGRNLDFAQDVFDGKPDAKEGYVLTDCLDPRVRNVFAFLIPIFYPERPGRITNTWANTICGSLQGKRAVDWSLLMQDTVSKMVKALPKTRISSLSSYLAHLYHFRELLLKDEAKSYREQEQIWVHGEPEADTLSEGSEPEATVPEEPPVATPPVRTGTRRKLTPRSGEQGRQARARIEVPEVRVAGDPESPCHRIMVAAQEAQEHIALQEEMLGEISSVVGCPRRSELVAAVEKALTNNSRIRELEKKVEQLQLEKRSLEELVREKSKKAEEEHQRAVASAQAITHVREALAIPAEVMNKAKIVDARLLQETELNRNKIIRFLVAQAETMEQTLEEMRTLADNMVPDVVPATTRRTQTTPDRGAGGAGPSAPGASGSGSDKGKAAMSPGTEAREAKEARAQQKPVRTSPGLHLAPDPRRAPVRRKTPDPPQKQNQGKPQQEPEPDLATKESAALEEAPESRKSSGEGSSRKRKRKFVRTEESDTSGDEVVTPFQQEGDDDVEVIEMTEPVPKTPGTKRAKYAHTPVRQATEAEGVDESPPRAGRRTPKTPGSAPAYGIRPAQTPPPASGTRSHGKARRTTSG